MRAWSFEGATLGGDDAWFAVCTSRRILDVANAYLRLWAKLSYVDLWYTAQQPASDERVASQNWHVDFDDKHLLKAFVYLSDVDAEHGPVRVRPRAARPAAGGSSRPWVPMGYGRVPDEEVAEKVARRRDRHVHRAEGHADPLQHERPPPRRLRDGRAARPRDRDVLLAGLVEGALEPELRVRARARPTRSSATPFDERAREPTRILNESARRRARSSTRASAGRRPAAAR